MKKVIIYPILVISLAFNLAVVIEIIRYNVNEFELKDDNMFQKRPRQMMLSGKDQRDMRRRNSDYNRDKRAFYELCLDDNISEDELFTRLDELSKKAKEFEYKTGRWLIKNRKELKGWDDDIIKKNQRRKKSKGELK